METMLSQQTFDHQVYPPSNISKVYDDAGDLKDALDGQIPLWMDNDHFLYNKLDSTHFFRTMLFPNYYVL